MGVAHTALDFGFGDERRNRIDGYNVDGVASYQDFGDLQGLFAVVGLTDQQVFDHDPEFAGNGYPGRVLRYKGGESSKLLGFGDNMKRQGGLAGRHGAKYLYDAAPRNASDTQRDIER